MKSLAIFSIALASIAFANPNDTANAVLPTTQKVLGKNHEFSFGPDVFWQNFSESKDLAETESNGVFGGLRLRYEYVKPDAFYAGTDGMFAVGGATSSTTVHKQIGTESTAVETDVTTSNTNTSLAANLEQRLGYTFTVNPSSTIAPFAGLGWYYTKPAANNDFSNDFVYAAAGFKAAHQVSNSINLGLVGKALYSFYDRTHTATESNSTWDTQAWGYAVELPITWDLGSTNSWQVSLEPYFQDLDVQNHFMNAGGRLMASYQY